MTELFNSVVTDLSPLVSSEMKPFALMLLNLISTYPLSLYNPYPKNCQALEHRYSHNKFVVYF